MTANELAEIADGLSCEIPIREWIDNEPKNVMNDIATMLRQQQAEIESLKKELALQMLSDIGQAIEEGELQALVKSFFDDYLDVQEESDSGRVFNPIHISCTRVMMTKPLGELLSRIKELSGAKQ